MTSTTMYWVWFSLALGTGNAKQKKIYDLYDSIKDFYDGGIYEWRLSGVFNDTSVYDTV